MQKILKNFYFLTKLSSSIILLLIIIFLIYVFYKGYVKQINLGDNNQLSEINIIQEQVSTSLEKTNKSVIDLIKKIENIESKIQSLESRDDLSNNTVKKEDLDEILNQILILKKDKSIANNLSQEGNLINEKIFLIDKHLSNIQLSIEKGLSYDDIIDELFKILPTNIAISHLEKLSIIANEGVKSYTELKNNFNSSSDLFLREYLIKKSGDSFFIQFFLNIFNLKPDRNNISEDKNVKRLSSAKIYLDQKNIQNAIDELLKIEDIELYFKIWIKEAEKYSESYKLIDLIKNEMQAQ
ncbi:MAG: hypothetical protein CMI92_00150 [Pelagibacteraceae bacterium]|nr:hypothetical protein [Pelagibacteraceae bacterium]|tara:strand:+ start:390 stop:1280 length:891 start_codon:yes stop_codon:yes gene_type:complete